MSYNISTGIYENEFELNSLITNNANAIELIEIVNNEQQNDIDTLQTNVINIQTCNVSLQGLINTLQTDVVAIETCNVSQQGLIDAIETCNLSQQVLITTLQTDVAAIETCNVSQQGLIDAIETCNVNQQGLINAIEACNVSQQGLITTLQTDVSAIETCNVNQQVLINAIETCNVSQQVLITTLQTDVAAIETCNLSQQGLINDIEIDLVNTSNDLIQYTNLNLANAKNYTDTSIDNHQSYFDINNGDPQLKNYVQYNDIEDTYSPVILENKLTLNDNNLIYKAYTAYDFDLQLASFNTFKISSSVDEFIKFETINNKLILIAQDGTSLLWHDDDKIWVKAIDNNQDNLRESLKILREVRAELTSLKTASAISDIITGALTVAGWIGSAFTDAMAFSSIAAMQYQLAALGISVGAVSGVNQSSFGYDLLSDFIDDVETIDDQNLAEELENRSFSQENYQQVILRYVGHMLRCYQYNVKHNFLPYPQGLDDYQNLVFKRGLGGTPARFDDYENIKTIIYDKTGITNKLFVAEDVIYDCTFDGDDSNSSSHKYFINGTSLKTKMTSIDTAISQINNKTTDEIQEGNNNLYSQWNDTGNNIYYNAGKVGIGTDTPTANLHIYDTGNPHLLLQDGYLDNQVKIQFKTTNYSYVLGLHGGENKMKVSEGNTFGANDLLILDSVGNFDVVGNVNIPDNKKYKINGNDLQYSDLANLPTDFDTNLSNVVDGTTITYTGGTLTAVGGGGSSQWTETGSDIYYTNGNVGIGTTVPANKLDVNGDFSVNRTSGAWSSSPNPAIYMRFNSADDVGHIQCIKRSDVSSYPLKFYASKYSFLLGNVGIGIANPVAKLHTTGDVRFGGTDNTSHFHYSTNEDVYIRTGTNNAGSKVIIADNSTNTNVGIGTQNPTAKLQVNGSVKLNVMSGYLTEGEVIFGRFDNIGRYHKISVFNSSTPANNYMKFAIHNGTEDSTTDVLTLNGAGNLGIGETNPAYKLDVDGDAKVSKLAIGGAVDTYFELKCYQDAWIDGRTVLNGSVGIGGTYDNTKALKVSGETIINGNVGIGTAEPEAKLDVVGDIKLTGSIYNEYQTGVIPSGTKWIKVAKYYYRCNCKFIIHYNGSGQHDLLEIEVKYKIRGGGYGECLIFKSCTAHNNQSFFSDIYIENYTAAYGIARNIWVKHESERTGNPTFYTYLERYNQLNPGESSLYDLTTYQTDSPTGGRNFKIQDAVIQTVNYNHEITDGNLTIDGDVGIGTVDPASKLDVVGDVNITGNYKINGTNIVTDDIGEGSTNLYSQWTTAGNDIYYSTGNVGIGTTNPESILHLENEYDTTDNLYETPGLFISSKNATDSWGVGYIGGYIKSGVDNSAGSYPGGLIFKTKPANGSANMTLTTQMVLNSAGNLGIGTTNPTEKLHVNGFLKCSSGVHEFIIGTPGNQTGFIFNGNNTGNRSRFDMFNSDNATVNNRYFGIGFNGDTNPLIIRKGGNVGIGKTNPSEKLHVQGDGRFQNNYQLYISAGGGGPYIAGGLSSYNQYFQIGAYSGINNFDNNNSRPLSIKYNGTEVARFSGSTYKLDVNGWSRTKGLTSTSDIILLNYNNYLVVKDWYIYQAPEDFNDYGNLDKDDLVFSYRGETGLITDRGLAWVSHLDWLADQLDWTGQHRGTTKNKNLYDKKYVGYIVSSTGEYKDLNSKYPKNQNRNIKINSALPCLDLSNKEQDKRCYGVISSHEEDTNIRTYHGAGLFKSSYKQDKGDTRIIINSLGEGAIWVSNYNGNIENGDYITSSPISGIGMKQSSEFLANYTVAKATCSVEFDNIQSYPLEKVKQIYIYTSNIKVEESNIEIVEPLSNLVYYSNVDEYSNIVITSNYEFSNVIKTQTINVSNLVITSNLENVLDENNNLIYEIQYDQNSNIIYEPEYEIKYIDIQGNILDIHQYDSNIHYKMCFIGCTYHCA